MMYMAICLSRSEGSSENFLVKDDNTGNYLFRTKEEVDIAVANDKAEYLASELEAGLKAKIVGNHIEWENGDGDREAKWYVYALEGVAPCPS